jgi:hypothetical protein
MSSKMPQPEVQTIKLHKNSNGMGLSIVAAKGAGQVSDNHRNLSHNVFMTYILFPIGAAWHLY